MKLNKKRTKIIFLVTSLFFIFLINLNLLESKSEDITFLVFGHVYEDYETLNLSIPLIEKENPDFIIFLGDSVAKVHNKYWEELNQIINKIKFPVYFVPGNHDIANKEDETYFRENVSRFLFQEFRIKDNSFIILNSIIDEEDYDISNEQVEFLESIYNNNKNNKFIFMHNCLFYQDGNKFCNSRGDSISKKSNWNAKIVPLIQNKTSAVFVGDIGVREPYLSYIEEDIHYFGVGFSSERLKFPQHMLKVIISEDSFTIEPIVLQKDLTQIISQAEGSFRSKLKLFILNNLKSVLISFLATISLLIVIILGILFKWKRKLR